MDTTDTPKRPSLSPRKRLRQQQSQRLQRQKPQIQRLQGQRSQRQRAQPQRQQIKRRQKTAGPFLDLAAYLFLPGMSLLFVRGSNWLTTNLSVLGNDSERQNAFVFWGLFVGIYFFTLLEKISGHLPSPPKGTVFVPLSLLLLTCALTTPYLPEQLPFRSFLHVLFAFLSAVCLALFVALLVFSLYRRRPDQFFLYPVGLSSILSGCILLFLAAKIISSALEIFFVLSLSLLCRTLEKKIARTELPGR